MTKATETALFLGVLSLAWLALLFGVAPLPRTIQNEIVPVLPWWALVSFGSYALFTLGYDVVTFNDKPEKMKELKKQILEAKRDLKLNGVAVSE